MAKRVKDLTLSLSEYAVVDEGATILDALLALEESQATLAPGRQPHRAVLVRDRHGAIIGKLHHFAFLRAFLAERRAMMEQKLLDRAGLEDDVLKASLHTLGFLTGDLVDVGARARAVPVRDVLTPATAGISEDASLADAAAAFLQHQTLSLLVHRGDRTVGLLRLSDLFDELARQVTREAGTRPRE
jgi:CBS domain-containing protein